MKEGLSNVKIKSEGTAGDSGSSPSGQGPPMQPVRGRRPEYGDRQAQDDDSGSGQGQPPSRQDAQGRQGNFPYQGPARGQEQEPQYRRYEGEAPPTIQHIDKQIIVTEFAQLPEKLGEEIKDLVSKQMQLRETLTEKEQQSRESKRRLEILMSRETQASHEVRIADERNDSLMRSIEDKKRALTQLDEQKRMVEAKYREALQRENAMKAKVDGILGRKKSLENKIHDLVEGSGDMYIDIAPYLKDVLAKAEADVAKSKEVRESLEVKSQAISDEIRSIEEELANVSRRRDVKAEELEEVKTKRAKIESELSLISSARGETESKLNDLVKQRKDLEAKLKELTGGGK